VEELYEEIGRLLIEAIPPGDRDRWSYAAARARYSPAAGPSPEGCEVEACYHLAADAPAVPLPLPVSMPGLFLRLRRAMAGLGSEWRRAVFYIDPGGRFDLDLEYD
jgi:hypothetical protein